MCCRVLLCALQVACSIIASFDNFPPHCFGQLVTTRICITQFLHQIALASFFLFFCTIFWTQLVSRQQGLCAVGLLCNRLQYIFCATFFLQSQVFCNLSLRSTVFSIHAFTTISSHSKAECGEQHSRSESFCTKKVLQETQVLHDLIFLHTVYLQKTGFCRQPSFSVDSTQVGRLYSPNSFPPKVISIQHHQPFCLFAWHLNTLCRLPTYAHNLLTGAYGTWMCLFWTKEFVPSYSFFASSLSLLQFLAAFWSQSLAKEGTERLTQDAPPFCSTFFHVSCPVLIAAWNFCLLLVSSMWYRYPKDPQSVFDAPFCHCKHLSIAFPCAPLLSSEPDWLLLKLQLFGAVGAGEGLVTSLFFNLCIFSARDPATNIDKANCNRRSGQHVQIESAIQDIYKP